MTPISPMARYAGSAALIWAMAVIIFVAGVNDLVHTFPDALDGLDVIDPKATPNYVRNVLELFSFSASFLVLITAIVALIFATGQIKEAKSTRLATLYAALEGRWSSPEMLASRAAFNAIVGRYPGPQGGSLPDFVNQELMKLRATNYYGYSVVMSLVDYLEYIGLLAKEKYLDIKDMDFLIGSPCLTVYTMMKAHILALAAEEKAKDIRSGLAKTPVPYECFVNLTREFAQRFATPEPE